MGCFFFFFFSLLKAALPVKRLKNDILSLIAITNKHIHSAFEKLKVVQVQHKAPKVQSDLVDLTL